MIILISTPEQFPGEAQLVDEMLGLHPEIFFHLRKPAWNFAETAGLLRSLDPVNHHRIVTHTHFALSGTFPIKGIHLREADRNAAGNSGAAISTSFHTIEAALSEGGRFEYFFCSPVFPSISKSGYGPSENWDISGESELFRSKAVALGGVAVSRKESLAEKGFENVAVLGAVWNSGNPVAAFDEIVRAFAR